MVDFSEWRAWIAFETSREHTQKKAHSVHRCFSIDIITCKPILYTRHTVPNLRRHTAEFEAAVALAVAAHLQHHFVAAALRQKCMSDQGGKYYIRVKELIANSQRRQNFCRICEMFSKSFL